MSLPSNARNLGYLYNCKGFHKQEKKKFNIMMKNIPKEKKIE